MVHLGFDSPKRVTEMSGGTLMLLVFETEPELTVRRDGPAAGRLRNGDVLVAIAGQAITMHAAARRYEYLRPSERVTFSV